MGAMLFCRSPETHRGHGPLLQRQGRTRQGRETYSFSWLPKSPSASVSIRKFSLSASVWNM